MCSGIFGGGGGGGNNNYTPPVQVQAPKQVSYADASASGDDERRRMAAAAGLASTNKTSPTGVNVDLTGYKKALTGM